MTTETKQKIMEFNNKFGIKTEFINDEAVLGYAIGNTIYINESVEQDYERTNKHELLHFFEQTEEFENIKETLFEQNKGKINEIRAEYELRYFGLYSEKEIQAGVLDNEIAIDLMIDNSSFEYEDGLKIGEHFLGQVEKSVEEKRYLNLSLTNNIRNLNLSKWEKIFVLNYYDGKERKLPQTDKINGIKADIEGYLEELYNISKEQMIIDSNSPEVIREYKSEIKALKARGENPEYLEQNEKRACKEIATKMTEDLYEQYKHIVDSMKGFDYESAFKCMILRETLTKTYKLGKVEENVANKIIEGKRDLHKSIASHMVLSEDILKIIYDKVNSIEQNNIKFANIYFGAMEIHKNSIAKKSEITLDGVKTYGKGKWIKFDGKNTDPEKYLNNAQELAALVQDTLWCTKTLASSQLTDGDFYVFVDNENKPHIAVKTNGNSIDEVRGIQNENAQELEEEYRDVAISFLENNKEIKNGKEWYEKEEWNKRLIEYGRKIDEGNFPIEDVPQFIEDYCRKDYRSHGGENSNKTALKEKLESVKDIFVEYYKCEENEICLGDIDYGKLGLKENPYRIILGNANFRDSQITDLGKLQNIGGNANFAFSKITNLGKLQNIGETAYFGNSQVIDLGELQRIGGDANFGNSQVIDLGELQRIGGNANFSNSQITDLGKLQSIGGNAYFDNSEITDLGNLQSIEGYVDFKKTKITDLGELQSIGGYAYFDNSQITNLGKLQSIGGYAYFCNSQITDLGNLQSIGGDANFANSQITDLGNLQRIGGYANFANSQITNLGKLQSIGGHVDFDNSQITDLGNLQSIGKYAYFGYSQVTNLGKLQSIGGYVTFENSKITDLGELQSIGGYANFANSQITNLGKLQSIGGDVHFANSQITNLGKLQSIGGRVDFGYSQITNLGRLKSIGEDASFGESQVIDLGELQSIGGNVLFNNSQITNLGKLQSIGGNVDFSYSQVIDLGELQSIEGNVNFAYSPITNLGKLQSIGKYANFGRSSITDLGELQSIGGNANFRHSSITDLGKLKNIHGKVILSEGEITLEDFRKILEERNKQEKKDVKSIARMTKDVPMEEVIKAKNVLETARESIQENKIE